MSDNNPFGDSQSKDDRNKFVAVLDKLLEIKELKYPFTLIIRDLVDNSFVQNPNYPEPDLRIKVHEFERTQDEDEELGITNMNVDNY